MSLSGGRSVAASPSWQYQQHQNEHHPPYALSRARNKQQQHQQQLQQQPLRSVLLNRVGSSSRSSCGGGARSRFLSPPSSPGGTTTRNTGGGGGSSVGGSRNSSGASVTFDLTMSPTIFIDNQQDQQDSHDQHHFNNTSAMEDLDDPNVSSLYHTHSNASSPGRNTTLSSSSSSFSSPHRFRRGNSNNSSFSSSSPHHGHHHQRDLVLSPPGAGGALQFVPATKKSMLLSPTDTTISTRCSHSHYSNNTTGTTITPIPGSSWDDDMDLDTGAEEKKESHAVDYFPRTTTSKSASGSGSSSVTSSLASRARQFRHARKQQQRGTFITGCASASSHHSQQYSSYHNDDSQSAYSGAGEAAAAPQTPPPPPRTRRLLLQPSYSDSSMQRQRQQRQQQPKDHSNMEYGEDDFDHGNNSSRGRSACPPASMMINQNKDRGGVGWASPSRSPIPHLSSSSFSPSAASARSLSPLRRPHRLVTPAATPTAAAEASALAGFSPLHDDRNRRRKSTSDYSSNSVGGAADAAAPAHLDSSGRVGRMAWLFSSRAAVPSRAGSSVQEEQEEKANAKSVNTSYTTTASISSPARSSGSSGYVGWPGTQDRRGATLAMHSSYEDSEADIQTTTSEQQHRQQQQRRKQEEKLLAARSEVGRWTGASKTITSPSSLSASSRARGATGSKKSVSVHAGPTSNSVSSAASSTTPSRNSEPALRSSLKSTLNCSSRHQNDDSQEENQSDGVDAATSNSNNNSTATPRQEPQQEPIDQLWSKMADEDRLSTPGTAYSKTSSAYFNEKDVRQSTKLEELAYPDFSTPNRPKASSTILQQQTRDVGYSPYGVRLRNAEAAVAAVLRRPASSSSSAASKVVVPPTEEFLAAKNRLSPPHRTFSAGSKGYVGLMDKTKEVPSLMDADAMDSDTSSRATSTHSCRPNNSSNSNNYIADNESDVFDGLSIMNESDVFDNVGSPKRTPMPTTRKVNNLSNHIRSTRTTADYPDAIAEETAASEENYEPFNMVVLGGGLAAIQPSEYLFSNRQTASDYDETLTNSDVDQNGYHRTPGVDEMLKAGLTTDSSLLGIQGNLGLRSQALFPENEPESSLSRSDSPQSCQSESELSSSNSSSLFSDPYNLSGNPLHAHGNLRSYYIGPSVMKRVLRIYRKCAERQCSPDMTLADFERQEDENKAFALFEMRSRIMERDIERGLERQGGTVVVDDLVMTTYNRTANRIRDAVVVSKAWRDGASPRDIINTALLTRRAERTYYIRRPIQANNQNKDVASTVNAYRSPKRYSWEPVKWVDDTDFLLYRCASLGPRCLRGVEMFTIGDCQSILLKLTNERCAELRRELNDATRRQIEAEDAMREEADEDDGFMTEAEMTYLTSMEEVKNISKDLVIAEQSFTLVRDRIEKLVEKYEALLLKIESESFAGAPSLVSYERSSVYSESSNWEEEEEREATMWARRARRAEIKAELAAREALMAKQKVWQLREEKERELEALQQKLIELQSEASNVISEREHSAILARAYAPTTHPHEHGTADSAATAFPVPDIQDAMSHASRVDKEKIDGVKQRFRDRMAAKNQGRGPTPSSSPLPPSLYGRPQLQRPLQEMSKPSSPQRPSLQSSLMRSAGEEMFSHLDFYERSLKSVANLRGSSP